MTLQKILHECFCFIEFIQELEKSDKMRGLPSFLTFFRNEFNKFNNTGAHLLESIYHITLKLFCKHFFLV